MEGNSIAIARDIRLLLHLKFRDISFDDGPCTENKSERTRVGLEAWILQIYPRFKHAHVDPVNLLRWNNTHVENFLSQNCNIFSVSSVFK